jgi:lipid-A-disaccharide synthase-like uncharacterized protein
LEPLFTIPIPGYALPIFAWTLFGFVGNLFYALRVLIQWLASERAGKSVVPVAFWWFSLSGAVVYITYAYIRAEIPFILGISATLVPYTRNLMIHYRPNRPPRPIGLVMAIASMLGCIPIIVFWRERTVLDYWFILGLCGIAVFHSRFYVQWVHSEAKRKSVMPLTFWYMSLVGSMLLLLYSLIRKDPVYILGFVFNVIPYTRNIMLIRKNRRA